MSVATQGALTSSMQSSTNPLIASKSTHASSQNFDGSKATRKRMQVNGGTKQFKASELVDNPMSVDDISNPVQD